MATILTMAHEPELDKYSLFFTRDISNQDKAIEEIEDFVKNENIILYKFGNPAVYLIEKRDLHKKSLEIGFRGTSSTFVENHTDIGILIGTKDDDEKAGILKILTDLDIKVTIGKGELFVVGYDKDLEMVCERVHDVYNNLHKYIRIDNGSVLNKAGVSFRKSLLRTGEKEVIHLDNKPLLYNGNDVFVYSGFTGVELNSFLQAYRNGRVTKGKLDLAIQKDNDNLYTLYNWGSGVEVVMNSILGIYSDFTLTAKGFMGSSTAEDRLIAEHLESQGLHLEPAPDNAVYRYYTKDIYKTILITEGMATYYVYSKINTAKVVNTTKSRETIEQRLRDLEKDVYSIQQSLKYIMERIGGKDVQA